MTEDKRSICELFIAERADQRVCDLVYVYELFLEVSVSHVAEKAEVGDDHIVANVTLVYRTLKTKLKHTCEYTFGS